MTSPKPRFRLTMSGWTMLAVAGAIFGASFVHRVNLLLLLFALILSAVWIGSRLGRRQLLAIDVRRFFPNLVPVGTPIACVLEVTNNHAKQPAVGLVAEDDILPRLPSPPAAVALPAIAPRETERARYSFIPNRRGQYRLGPVRIATTYPFGLVRYKRMFLENGARDVVIVHPAVGSLSVEGHQSLGMMTQGDGRGTSGLREGIDEFRGVRDYRDGDPSRLIHWRSTARRGALVVRELDPTASRNILLLVHLRCDRATPAARVEEVLSFAATVVTTVCRDPTLKLTVVVAARTPTLIRGSAGKARSAGYLRPLALAEPSADAETLARACRELSATDTRDRRLWVLSAGGLSAAENEVLQGGGFRRISALRVLNASAGDLAGLWVPPAARETNDTPQVVRGLGE